MMVAFSIGRPLVAVHDTSTLAQRCRRGRPPHRLLMTTGLLGWGSLLRSRYRVTWIQTTAGAVCAGRINCRRTMANTHHGRVDIRWPLGPAGHSFRRQHLGRAYNSLFFADRILESGLFPYYKVQSFFCSSAAPRRVSVYCLDRANTDRTYRRGDFDEVLAILF